MPMSKIFPSDQFSPEAYRLKNPRLSRFSDGQLINHYRKYGKKENRISTIISNREEFLGLLVGKKSLLEIGVFDSPSLGFLTDSDEAPLIHYADFLSREELISRADQISLNGGNRVSENVPEIRWVLSEGYKKINIIYDAVVSHHCVEHQPDLVAHLWNVKSILCSGGWYLFSIPNKHHCFDHFIPESTIVDVIAAHYSECKRPSFKSVLEHRVFTSHTFQDGINPYNALDSSAKSRIEMAFKEFSENEYVDVHCWQFSPLSIKKIFNQLMVLELIPSIAELKVYPGGSEFYVAIAFE